MNLGWKDYYIIITLFIFGVLAMFTIINLIEKLSIVGFESAIGFIGAILGGLISGGLTLLGVKKTIKEQRRMMLQEKIDKADFIYQKMVRVNSLDFFINNSPKDVYDNAETLIEIIDEHSKMLNESEIEFVIRIEFIRKELKSIKKLFDDNDGPNGMFVHKIVDSLVIHNGFIQNTFISLKDDYFSKYK